MLHSRDLGNHEHTRTTRPGRGIYARAPQDHPRCRRAQLHARRLPSHDHAGRGGGGRHEPRQPLPLFPLQGRAGRRASASATAPDWRSEFADDARTPAATSSPPSAISAAGTSRTAGNRDKAKLCLEIWAEATRNPAIAALQTEFDRSFERAARRGLRERPSSRARSIPTSTCAPSPPSSASSATGFSCAARVATDFDAEREIAEVFAVIGALLKGAIKFPGSLRPTTRRARHDVSAASSPSILVVAATLWIGSGVLGRTEAPTKTADEAERRRRRSRCSRSPSSTARGRAACAHDRRCPAAPRPTTARAPIARTAGSIVELKVRRGDRREGGRRHRRSCPTRRARRRSPRPRRMVAEAPDRPRGQDAS